ncbi:carboxypeptidase regulatory-like domain-containing protein [Solirubrobacter soli]|uniref:carboxypeptidase regulatory-like domain-containing protein n=1 Tax=Solirubrobacter soli TaxID=363832 RepID=UPI000427E9D3|nr:Calx-beta domain-containing protein [Solirubrobacter soli]
MVAALRSLLVATALLAVLAPTAAAQDPPCDRTWNGTSGNWNDGSRWSGGAAPNTIERACLPAGSYTVTVTGGTSPKGVTVGAGVTAVIKESQYIDGRAANVINHGTIRLEQNATLYGSLLNDGTVEDTGTIPAGNNRPVLTGGPITSSGTIRANQGLNINREANTFESTGKLETANASALLNATGYGDAAITLSGTIANPGTMQFQGGTMRVRAITSQTGVPFKTYDAKLDLTGAGASTVETNNTVDLVSNIPAGVTVRVTGRTNDGYLRMDGDRTNSGTLVFDSSDQFHGTYLTNISAAARLTNAGTLRVTGVAGTDRNFRIPITNTGTVTVDAGTRMVFQNDAGETITSGAWNANGNVWVQGGGSSPAQITQTGGAITVAAGVTLFVTNGGRYVHQGGTTSGELQFQNGSTLDASGPGAATYHVVGYVNLGGDINAAATVNLDANGGQPANLTLAAPRTLAGRMTFTTTGANAQDTELNGGQRLTVTGRIDVQRGVGGTRHFKVPLTIAAGGQLNVEALATAVMDTGGTTDNQLAGTVNIAGGGYLGVRSGNQTVTQTGGTIPGAGTFGFENGNTFVHSGGTVTGEVQFYNGSSLDASGPGAATYHVLGYANLAGDVNAAATVNLDANGGQPANLTLAAPRTVAGRMTFTTTGANAQDTELNGGQRLTVTGRIDVTKGSGGNRWFRVPVTIAAAGQFNVNADARAYLGNGAVTDHQFAGTVNVAAGAYFGVQSGTQTVTQTAGSITGPGTFSIENFGTYVHQGGTVPGELQLQNGAALDPSGPGAATYHVVGVVKLVGDVNAAATINADSSNSSTAQLTLTAPRTVAGRVNLTSTAANDTTINGLDGASHRLTVTGRLEAQKGVGGIRNLTTIPLTIAAGGQFNVEPDTRVYVNSDGRTLDHQLAGNVTVGANGLLLWRVASQTVTQTAGTITATGSFNVEGNTFKHQGGSAIGLVTISSGGLRGQLDPSGPGTMAYKIANGVNLTADISADASVQIGDATTGGQLFVRDRDVTNNGAIQVGPDGAVPGAQLNDDGQPYKLTNAGSIVVGTGGGRELHLAVINTGTMNVKTDFGSGFLGSAIPSQPLITNQGGTVTLDHAGVSVMGGYTQTSGTTDMTESSLSSWRAAPIADIKILGGRLRGTGVLTGPVTNAGTIEVGRAGTYGKLQIKDVFDQIVRVAASYTQTPTGRLAIDVGGKVAGTSYDQLTVDGPAALDGALDVTTAAGYTPTPNTDTYRPVLSETRTGVFANLTGGRFYTLSHDATGAVLTGRVPPPPTGELTIGDASILEGAGPLTFTVTMSKASTDPVTVDWATEDDTATAGADYVAGSGTLTFPPGTTTRTVTVAVVNDQVVEGVKRFLLRLKRPVNATLDVATGVGRIDPDDVGITNAAPTSLGIAGNATVVVSGGGFGPGTKAKLTRAGLPDRVGTITSGPENGSKFSARFDMRGAAQGQWLLVVTTPSGTANTPITVQAGSSALYASLSVPASLRYGWVGQALLSIRNAGSNDVQLDGVRFTGTDLELRAVGATDFAKRLMVADTQLGDAQVIPALSTRTVIVEVRSTTLVGHAFMKVDAELYPTGYAPVEGSDPDPGNGSIAGTVTSAAGTPVRGLRVTAFDGAHSASALTDGSGNYVLKPLKPGTYRVEAGGAKGSAAVNENARTVDLVTGVTELSGSVGKGDATVLLLRDGSEVARVAADATGGFRFRVTQPGAYTLVADSPTGGRASRAVTVVAGVDQPGLALTLGTRTLTVTTTAGAQVRVWPAGEEGAPSVRTATGTTVTLPGMPAGLLTVEARAAGKASARATTSANAVTVTPTAGSPIGGRVTQAGTPVEGALVVADHRLATTGADGRYSIAGLTGSQDVWVLAPGAAPLVKRAVAAGSTTADAAVVTTGGTLDVKVGAGAVGRLVEVVDPATGVTIAAAGTVGPDAVAHFGPLPAGTFEVRGAGAGTRTVTVGSSAKAVRAAAPRETITLDDDGYPVVADPEHDPAYDEYTSPFSGLKAPQLNEKDKAGWDQVIADYPGPCPTADRLIDTIRLKQRAKLAAFSAWVEAWDAVDTQNRADIEKLMTMSAQFTANSFLALATMAELPPNVSPALSQALGNLANYVGTLTTQGQGLLDPLTAVDYTQYFKDMVDTLASFAVEYGAEGGELANFSSLINILKGLIDISSAAEEFPNEVAARANGYLEAQGRYEQMLREINDLLNQYNEAKKRCPEPLDRGPKPPVSSGGQIENITSNDPNEILGPAGVGAQKWIPRAQTLGYSIRFENLGPGSVIPPGQQPASAPATVVKVVTTLSPSVDVDQVTLGGVGWGKVELAVPAGLTTYHKDVPQDDGDIVRVDGAVNAGARSITWTLKTIDPNTGEIDGSPTAGFLPPEDGTRRGQGHVDYRAGTPDSVAQGTAIAAKATITFDVNAPIETNTHTNTVDGAAPAATLTLGTATCEGKLPVSWNGTDTGSGVVSYDVEVSKDGGLTWSKWLADTATTSGTYPGTPGKAYAFRVMARDAVGNQETAPGTPDATVTLAPCDLTPPRTTATLPGGAVGGWYGGPVDVKLDAVDAPGGSGVKTLRYAGKQVSAATVTERVGAEGVTDFVFSAVDAKGNAEADAHLPVRIDTTAPAITGTDGVAYALGQAAVPDATCADAGSGIASCDVPAALDTSAAGTFSYTVGAADKLGHTATRTFTYTVAAPQPAPSATPTPTPSPGPAFGATPVTVKLGKVTRTSAVVTLTSKEAFAFTGKATLLTAAKKPKAQSKIASFSLLAKGKSAKVTLKLKPALKTGKAVKLVLRLELRSGNATKVVDVKVTLRAR